MLTSMYKYYQCPAYNNAHQSGNSHQSSSYRALSREYSNPFKVFAPQQCAIASVQLRYMTTEYIRMTTHS